MEHKNFFTSGWLFLSIAILNLVIAGIFGPLIASSPGSLDEWLLPLFFLIPMSIALAIVGIFVPRGKIGVKRWLTVGFNFMSCVLYGIALVAILTYEPTYYYYY